MSAAKKLVDAVAGFFSEAARARQDVDKAQAAVTEAQRLFDASPSQAAGESLMAAKRDLEHAKLFVDRAERLGAEEQRKADDETRTARWKELATLEAAADTHNASADIAAMVEAARPAFEALAKLDRDVLKRLRKATDAARTAEQIRAQLEGRPVDRSRIQVAAQAVAALDRMHTVSASSLVQRTGLLDNLRWLARL